MVILYRPNFIQCTSFHFFPRSLLRGCSPLQHPIVILRETSAADLEAILEFVYHGEVSVEEAQLESFLRSARVLQISGLTETRCGSLSTQISF